MAKDTIEVVVNTPKKSKVIESPKTPKVPEGMIECKTGQYRCIKKCYFGISLYEVGAIYEAQAGEFIPKHFVKVKRVVEVDD